MSLLKNNVKNVKTESFIWNDVAKTTFKKLKKKFIKTLILKHFNLKKRIKIKINAFEFVIASNFSQIYKNVQ